MKIPTTSMDKDLAYCQRQILKLFDTYPDLTNQKLGDIADVTPTSVSHWRNGHKRIYPYSQERIIKKFNLPEDYFRRPLSDEEVIKGNIQNVFSKLDPKDLAFAYESIFDSEKRSKINNLLTEKDNPKCKMKELENGDENVFLTEEMKKISSAIIFLSENDLTFKRDYPFFFEQDSSFDFNYDDVLRALQVITDFVRAARWLWSRVYLSNFMIEKDIAKMKDENASPRRIKQRYPVYDFLIQCSFDDRGQMHTRAFENPALNIEPMAKPSVLTSGDKENNPNDNE